MSVSTNNSIPDNDSDLWAMFSVDCSRGYNDFRLPDAVTVMMQLLSRDFP